MSQQPNPFEAPHANPFTAELPRGETNGQIDVTLALSEAWRSTWDNFPLWLGVMFVAWFVNAVAGITFIGYFIITPVIMYGMFKSWLNMLEPNKADFQDLFAGFNNFGSALLPMYGYSLVMGGIPFVPMIVAAILENQPLIIISMLLMAVHYLVVWPRIGYACFFIVDKNMGSMDAVRASWDATRGQYWPSLGLMLLSALVSMVGILALLIGVLASAQVSYLMFAAAYRQMVPAEPKPITR
jgi:hypothetical protein